MTIGVVEFLLSGMTDTSDNPLASGKVYTYAAGTTTPKATYVDSLGATPEANPVILDAYGRKQIFASGAYKFVIKTAANVTLYTFDNILFGNISDFGGTEATSLANGTARTSAATVGQLQDGAVTAGGTSSGAANVYAITLTPAITAYVAGMRLSFGAHQTNTAACTLNVNGVGAVGIKKKNSSSSIAPGDIQNGAVVEVIYDGTNWRMIDITEENAFTTIAAAGTTQGTATTLTARNVNITGTLHQGVILPASIPGDKYTILNGSSVPLCIYPPVGGSFQGFSANQFITLLASQSVILTTYASNIWLHQISAGVFQTNIAATGTTQGTGYQILYPTNNVVTTSVGQTAITLPHPHPGMQIMIMQHDTSDDVLLFPASGDTIGAGAANASISVKAVSGVLLYGVTNSAWQGYYFYVSAASIAIT